jgi:membrane associated rhomboid family serine protease
MLSLDAVLVGLVWQEIFFQHLGQQGHWKYRLILGTAIWLAYMADRLFDNLALDSKKPTTRRHAFIRNNWKTILTVWLIVFTSILILSIFTLSKAEFIGGLWITLLINLYFLILKLSKRIPILGSLKEIFTGTLFALGVSYFPIFLLKDVAYETVGTQITFGLLCFANVILISHWEHTIDKHQQEGKLSQRRFDRDVLLKVLLTMLGCYGIYLVTMANELFSWAVLLSSMGLSILYLEANNRGYYNLKFLIDVPLILPCLLFFIF